MVQNYDATARSIASPGATLGTDWEQRVDFARLRADRTGKVRDALVFRTRSFFLSDFGQQFAG
jgi:hypothetical protein